MCAHWAAPDVVRTDNGPEFQNAIVDSLLRVFGVKVCSGAVQHPQLQGTAERFNRTLLGLVRKTIDVSTDWKADLNVLLYYYRMRPHSSTGITPMEAMVGWMPNRFIIENMPEAYALSDYVVRLSERSASI